MKRDPFYVKDSFTEQLEREEQMRNEKRKAFMDEHAEIILRENAIENLRQL